MWRKHSGFTVSLQKLCLLTQWNQVWRTKSSSDAMGMAAASGGPGLELVMQDRANFPKLVGEDQALN